MKMERLAEAIEPEAKRSKPLTLEDRSTEPTEKIPSLLKRMVEEKDSASARVTSKKSKKTKKSKTSKKTKKPRKVSKTKKVKKTRKN